MKPSFHRCLGLELSGARNARSVIAVFDYFPDLPKLVLREIVNSNPSGFHNDDEKLLECLEELSSPATALQQGIYVNAALSLPPTLLPKEEREEQENWMQDSWNSLEEKPKPFLPYLQRPAEIYLRHLSPSHFPIADSFSQNAPLSFRALNLKEKINGTFFEVNNRISLFQFGQSLKINPYSIQSLGSLTDGLRYRQEFLQSLKSNFPALFIYEEIEESLLLKLEEFQAFITGLTGFLHSNSASLKRPRNFPKSASWIQVPKVKNTFFDV